MKTKAAGKLAQAYISVLGRPVGIDGAVGTKTRAAFAALKPRDQKSVIDTVKPFDSQIVSRLQGPEDSSGTWHSLESLQGFIADASKLSGIPSDWLVRLIDLEAKKKVVNGVVYYDAMSKNGQHLGLTQMSKAAWTDSNDFAKSRARGLKSRGVSYNSKNAYDPELSIHAAAGFGGRNKQYAANFGVQRAWSFELFYMMHNQGLGFIPLVRNLSKTGKIESSLLGNQSGPAKQVAKQAADLVIRYS